MVLVLVARGEDGSGFAQMSDRSNQWMVPVRGGLENDGIKPHQTNDAHCHSLAPSTLARNISSDSSHEDITVLVGRVVLLPMILDRVHVKTWQKN
jgi:hypothetical protein